VTYAIEAQALDAVGALFNTAISSVGPILRDIVGNPASILSITVAAALPLSKLFTILSGFYLTLSGPVVVAVGLLFVQFLTMPIIQYFSFSVLLPVGIAMRSLAFMGENLKVASNSIIAIAIALYIIYPLMIVFNSYAISWIFSSANPSYVYLSSTYQVASIPVSGFFNQVPITTYSGFWGTFFKSALGFILSGNSPIGNFVDSASTQAGGTVFFSGYPIYWPSIVFAQLQNTVVQTAQFFFTAIILVLIDVAVTMGFAMGLRNALNAGVEGLGSFWRGI
jgi:hypothetical protein